MASRQCNKRERLVLQHLCRYRFSFTEVMSQLYFQGKDPQKTLKQMSEEGLVTLDSVEGLLGNRKLYRPTNDGADQVGGGQYHHNSMGGLAFNRFFSIYSYCFFTKQSRCLLYASEGKRWYDAFGTKSQNRKGIYFVVEDNQPKPQLQLLAYVSEKASPGAIRSKAQRFLSVIEKSNELSSLDVRNRLDVIFITPSPEVAQRTQNTLHASKMEQIKAVSVPWLEQISKELNDVA